MGIAKAMPIFCIIYLFWKSIPTRISGIGIFQCDFALLNEFPSPYAEEWLQETSSACHGRVNLF